MTQIDGSIMARFVPDRLREIAKQVRQGERPTATVRTLLSWFFAKRRGSFIAEAIRNALDELGITTEPNFNWIHLDGNIAFIPKPAPSQTPSQPREAVHSGDVVVAEEELIVSQLDDPTYRIGRLESANKRPVSVTPNTSVREAVTVMLANDFSQLPVMTSEITVKGMFSWKSLAQRMGLGYRCESVSDCLDQHYEVRFDTPLLDAVDMIVQHEAVLVRDGTNKICGIVTTSDLSVQFGELGEPFLLLGEVENHLRSLLHGKFSLSELASARESSDLTRQVQAVSDLSLGEIMRFLEKPERWEHIGLGIDRVVFTKGLDEVRRIRNDVMHFDPDGLSDEDLETLRRFVQFLQRLREIGSGVVRGESG